LNSYIRRNEKRRGEEEKGEEGAVELHIEGRLHVACKTQDTCPSLVIAKKVLIHRQLPIGLFRVKCMVDSWVLFFIEGTQNDIRYEVKQW